MPLIDAAEIQKRVTYHPPSPAKVERHAAIRATITVAMEDIVHATPESREQSLAITNLEQALFWANAAVARGPEPED